jgi:hypothetical protein
MPGLRSLGTVNSNFTEKPGKRPEAETFSVPMTCSNASELVTEPVMNTRNLQYSEQIDYRTSRSICDAIGERLQQDLRPDASRLSSHLKYLLDELRMRDRDDRHRSTS